MLVKVGLIIDFLATTESAGPTEVAKAVGINKSTAFRLLSSLCGLGLLDNDTESGSYRLGLRLMELGNLVHRRLDLVRLARPVLSALNDQTGATVFLCKRDGDWAVCLDRIPGRGVDVLELQPGGRLPLHIGGVGLILLAANDDEGLDRFLARATLSSRTEHTITDPAELRSQLAIVRERGFSISIEDVTPGVFAIGAPIVGSSGNVEAAVSVSGLLAQVSDEDMDDLTAQLLAATSEIGRRLGRT